MFRREVVSSIDIAAPSGVVWDVLVDLPAYPDWNPFTPRIDTEGLVVGNHVDLHVRLPGRSARVQREWVNLIESERTLCWGMTILHRGFLVANRWQELGPLPDGGTRYTSTDRLSGLLAPIVMTFYGESMRAGFALCGEALKEAAEARANKEESR